MEISNLWMGGSIPGHNQMEDTLEHLMDRQTEHFILAPRGYRCKQGQGDPSALTGFSPQPHAKFYNL